MDVIDIRRIERLWITGGDRFSRRWFTHMEITDAEAAEHPPTRYAAFLAVKEAVWKAMGVRTTTPNVPWRSISVTSATADTPAGVVLSGELELAATAALLTNISAQYSLQGQLAVAFAIAERRTTPISANLRG